TGATASSASWRTSTLATPRCTMRPRRTSRWSRRSRRRRPVTDYPALGFDPAPGDCAALEQVGRAWLSLSERLAEEAGGLDALRAGMTWTGLAAQACLARLHVVPGDLHAAADACRSAGRTLQTYADELRRL